MKLNRLHLWRTVGVVGAFGLAVVVLPHLLDHGVKHQAPAWFGKQQGSVVAFQDVAVGDVLESVAQRTGFRAVAFPAVANMPFSGALDLDHGGEAAVRDLANQSGLELRKGGPHWVLVAGDTRSAH